MIDYVGRALQDYDRLLLAIVCSWYVTLGLDRKRDILPLLLLVSSLTDHTIANRRSIIVYSALSKRRPFLTFHHWSFRLVHVKHFFKVLTPWILSLIMVINMDLIIFRKRALLELDWNFLYSHFRRLLCISPWWLFRSCAYLAIFLLNDVKTLLPSLELCHSLLFFEVAQVLLRQGGSRMSEGLDRRAAVVQAFLITFLDSFIFYSVKAHLAIVIFPRIHVHITRLRTEKSSRPLGLSEFWENRTFVSISIRITGVFQEVSLWNFIAPKQFRHVRQGLRDVRFAILSFLHFDQLGVVFLKCNLQFCVLFHISLSIWVIISLLDLVEKFGCPRT